MTSTYATTAVLSRLTWEAAARSLRQMGKAGRRDGKAPRDAKDAALLVPSIADRPRYRGGTLVPTYRRRGRAEGLRSGDEALEVRDYGPIVRDDHTSRPDKALVHGSLHAAAITECTSQGEVTRRFGRVDFLLIDEQRPGGVDGPCLPVDDDGRAADRDTVLITGETHVISLAKVGPDPFDYVICPRLAARTDPTQTTGSDGSTLESVGKSRTLRGKSVNLHWLGVCVPPRAHVQFSVQEVSMKTMSYTESRAHYAEVLDGVANDREEVIITRSGHEPVVIVSLEDYESLRETAYLMRSPTNARRLLDAMERLESGRGESHDLIETD